MKLGGTGRGGPSIEDGQETIKEIDILKFDRVRCMFDMFSFEVEERWSFDMT